MDPTAQALYMWLCSYANESDECFPSRATLAADVGVSPRTIDAALELLIGASLVKKQVRYKENEQLSNLYTVIVKEGGAEFARGGAEFALPPVQNLRTELNPILTQTSGDKLRVESYSLKEEEPRARSKAKYPHAKEVFGWFPRPEKSWQIDTTQLKHAELLHERGEARVKKALVFVAKHKDDEYFPKITKPSDLERKWNDLATIKI